jgi:hypothetical protein
MTSGVTEVVTDDGADDMAEATTEAPAGTSAGCRTSELPCVVCLTTLSMDDDQPKLGTVRWQLFQYFGLTRGKVVSFCCPRGHSSDDDPELLKAFPTRTF